MTLKYNPITWMIRKLAWRFGLDICSFINLKDIIAECDAIVDVGAFDGDTYGDFRSLFGFKGEITCFEPSPAAFGRLLKRNTYNCTKHNCCCGEAVGKVDFYLKDGGGKHDSVYNNGGEKITVESRRIDSFNIKGNRLFFKVDTEGHDVEAFRGASGLHTRIKYVLMEVNMDKFAETIAEMKRLGFVVINSAGNNMALSRKRSNCFDLVFENEKMP